jgi:MFS transporter, NNP family, nitrate/nitrite transporter
MIGGLGGFILPIAFGALNDLTGIWSSCFVLLFLLATGCLVWMHVAVRRMERIEPATAIAAEAGATS